MSDTVKSEFAQAPLVQARLMLALRAGGAGTWQWDQRTGEVYFDAALERIFGLEPGAFAGTFSAWAALLHPGDREEVLASVDQSMRSGDEHEIEHRIVHPGGAVRWLHGRGQRIVDEHGEAIGLHGVAVDITDRRQAEAERDRLLAAEQHAREQLAFLSDATAVLSRSLSAKAAMTELVNLAVPRLADWCTVDVVSGDELQLVAAAHREPANVAFVRRWREENPPNPQHGAGKVVRTGEPELLLEIDDAVLRRAATDHEHLELLRSLQLRSAVVVPLMTRNRVLGALTLIHDATSGRQHTDDDLALARELGSRAGVALDNANLFQDRAQVANVLQRALLPPRLPTVPGLQVAARHQPAAQAVIGGDFYDLFENSDGSWTVLVGDVCGKDTTAATLTALARHSARAAAVRDADPTSVLDVVNQAFVQQSSAEQFCTAVCCRLYPREGGAALEVAVAGHPQPVVLRTDGVVEPVPASGSLIGLLDALDLDAETVRLEPGETIVLYTDGIVEARRDSELFGEQRLLATLTHNQQLDAGSLVDRLLGAVAAFDNGDRRDDVAVLALRVPR